MTKSYTGDSRFSQSEHATAMAEVSYFLCDLVLIVPKLVPCNMELLNTENFGYFLLCIKRIWHIFPAYLVYNDTFEGVYI